MRYYTGCLLLRESVKAVWVAAAANADGSHVDQQLPGRGPARASC
jgi:hypothetical protein